LLKTNFPIGEVLRKRVAPSLAYRKNPVGNAIPPMAREAVEKYLRQKRRLVNMRKIGNTGGLFEAK